jgi:hypothetical protein
MEGEVPRLKKAVGTGKMEAGQRGVPNMRTLADDAREAERKEGMPPG